MAFKKILFLPIFFLSCFVYVTESESVAWIGQRSGSWEIPSNWNTSSIPTTSSSVILNLNQHTIVTIASNVTLHALTVISGMILLQENSTLTVLSGGITVYSGQLACDQPIVDLPQHHQIPIDTHYDTVYHNRHSKVISYGDSFFYGRYNATSAVDINRLKYVMWHQHAGNLTCQDSDLILTNSTIHIHRDAGMNIELPPTSDTLRIKADRSRIHFNHFPKQILNIHIQL